MRFLHKLSPCLALLFTAVILVACSQEATTNAKFPTNTPSMLRAINIELLSVDVQIDNTGPIYKGVRNEDGTWDVKLTISLDTNHNFVAKWFVMVGTDRLLVLEQRGFFYADSTVTSGDPSETQTISSGEPQFDYDCDGMSNLEELMDLNTDPLGPSGCESTTTIEPTDTTPTNTTPTITISTIPDVTPLTGGCFTMGSPEFDPNGSGELNVFREPDERQHQVCVEPFSIGIYEVTETQWSQFDGSRIISNRPIRNITREEVDAYTIWLSNETGETYRLPTEAEFEFAARGGTTTRYWSGDTLADNQENFNSSNTWGGAIQTEERLALPSGILPVGSLQPNPYGLYDITGNALEHTCSAYSENYESELETYCSASPGVEHVFRSADQANHVLWARPARRAGTLRYTERHGGVGFRIVKESR